MMNYQASQQIPPEIMDEEFENGLSVLWVLLKEMEERIDPTKDVLSKNDVEGAYNYLNRIKFTDARCGCWCFMGDKEPPTSWTDGVCWASNQDGVPSARPTDWKPILRAA